MNKCVEPTNALLLRVSIEIVNVSKSIEIKDSSELTPVVICDVISVVLSMTHDRLTTALPIHFQIR